MSCVVIVGAGDRRAVMCSALSYFAAIMLLDTLLASLHREGLWLDRCPAAERATSFCNT